MKYRDLIKHWGSEAAMARSLGWHRQKINRWKKVIPIDQQIKIEEITGGTLRADLPAVVRQTA